MLTKTQQDIKCQNGSEWAQVFQGHDNASTNFPIWPQLNIRKGSHHLSKMS
jgi:hypothetical protein